MRTGQGEITTVGGATTIAAIALRDLESATRANFGAQHGLSPSGILLK